MTANRKLSPLKWATLIVLIGSSVGAMSCQICIPFPQKSIADYLIESDCVALAREDPAQPFSFIIVEVLSGNFDGEKPDLFLDSTTRRLLNDCTNCAVILVKLVENDGSSSWRRIGMTSQELDRMTREILELAPRWEQKPLQRFEYFAQLLDHAEPPIRKMAHIEIARAPYSQIVRYGTAIPREKVLQYLDNYRYIEWHSLYLLLLAQSGESNDHEWIYRALRSAAKHGTTIRLAALATADIEIREEKAIEFIQTEYFSNSKRTPKEIRAVLQALSVHGSDGHVHLRNHIVESYRELLKNYPHFALIVVDDLKRWNRTDLSAEIVKIATTPTRGLSMQSRAQLLKFVRNSRKE